MACLWSYQNFLRERKPTVSPVWKLMLSIVQVGACLDLLVCENDRLPCHCWNSSPDSWRIRRMPSLLVWTPSCYHDNPHIGNLRVSWTLISPYCTLGKCCKFFVCLLYKQYAVIQGCKESAESAKPVGERSKKFPKAFPYAKTVSCYYFSKLHMLITFHTVKKKKRQSKDKLLFLKATDCFQNL